MQQKEILKLAGIIIATLLIAWMERKYYGVSAMSGLVAVILYSLVFRNKTPSLFNQPWKNKSIIWILVILFLLLNFGLFAYDSHVDKQQYLERQKQQTQTSASETTEQNPGTEAPVTEKEANGQPANLVSAYSKNGKNYIDVDYLEWLHKEAAAKALVEDGKCPNLNECEVYPNGYHRNRNPKIRTFEVSPTATIKLEGINILGMMSYYKLINDKQYEDLNPLLKGSPTSISFPQLKEVTTKIRAEKEPMDIFITINVDGGLVTKIFEPYQE